MHIGERIKLLRLLHGMGQQELADAINVQQAKVPKYEGGRHVPRSKMLAEIARALECNAKWLSTGEGAPFLCGAFSVPARCYDGKERAVTRVVSDLSILLPSLIAEQQVSDVYVARVSDLPNLIALFPLQEGGILIIQARDGFCVELDEIVRSLKMLRRAEITYAQFETFFGQAAESHAARRELLDSFELLLRGECLAQLEEFIRRVSYRKIWKVRTVITLKNEEGITESEAREMIQKIITMRKGEGTELEVIFE
ncbi:helix-turn-helix domain-containing protein [Geobacter sp.]|uniref:helix-turn-helix domain-containing protein n=1 Tax=Geobacter sp. TaxID=46610 RepID=UPI0027BAC57C|nr:helix-turn-helix transcriptional regulator [Geobacter sp.]